MPAIQLFITCLVDSFYPETGEAVVEIFQRLGVNVDFPRDQTCCGQPNFNAGLRSEDDERLSRALKSTNVTMLRVDGAGTGRSAFVSDRSEYEK